MPRLTPDYPGYRKPPRFAYLRSFLPVLFLILLFSFSLASYSLLSHFRSPAGKQQIGVKNETLEEGETTQHDDFVPSIPLDDWVSCALFVWQ